MTKTFLIEVMQLPEEQDLPWETCCQLSARLRSQLTSDGQSTDLCRAKGMRIVGQDELVDRIEMSLLLNEHILLEGLPGVAKTQSVKFLAQDTGLMYLRVQFYPDMQPSDLVGKNVFNIRRLQEAAGGATAVKDEEIEGWHNGPLFCNLLVADEINRAPSKVQAALLEAMGERQITPLGHSRHVIRSTREWEMWLRYVRRLELSGRITGEIWGEYQPTIGSQPVAALDPAVLQPAVVALCNQRLNRFGTDFPFGPQFGWRDPVPAFGASSIDLSQPGDSQQCTFATQNPIEQSGTFPMSEAQTDRFNMKHFVPYPDFESLRDIARMINRPQPEPDPDVRYVRPPEAEVTAADRADRDQALRATLYFLRRCRDHLFGAPGNAAGSRLGELLTQDSETLTKMTRIVFYTHTKMPRTARAGEGQSLLLDREQQQRMNYLHAYDPKSLPMLAASDVFEYVNSGASPRGIMSLARTALAHAFLRGDKRVGDKDIRAVAADVLGHRIRMNSQARVRDITSRTLLNIVLDQVLG
jgi:MoxR-like ATPase